MITLWQDGRNVHTLKHLPIEKYRDALYFLARSGESSRRRSQSFCRYNWIRDSTRSNRNRTPKSPSSRQSLDGDLNRYSSSLLIQRAIAFQLASCKHWICFLTAFLFVEPDSGQMQSLLQITMIGFTNQSYHAVQWGNQLIDRTRVLAQPRWPWPCSGQSATSSRSLIGQRENDANGGGDVGDVVSLQCSADSACVCVGAHSTHTAGPAITWHIRVTDFHSFIQAF